MVDLSKIRRLSTESARSIIAVNIELKNHEKLCAEPLLNTFVHTDGTPLQDLSHTPKISKTVMNYHRQIISVINLHQKFMLKQQVSMPNTRIIIAQYRDGVIEYMVDQIMEVFSLVSDKIRVRLIEISSSTRPYISGLVSYCTRETQEWSEDIIVI